MRLYLVQHGEAVVKDGDPARPLTDRGRRDAGKTAEFLRIAGITVDIIWHSAKQRARETAEIFAEILSLQKGPVRTVRQDQYEFYEKWYYSAVRELVAIYKITDDYNYLARLLKPPIKPNEAKSALEVLTRLGLIKKTKSGIYKRVDAVITSGSVIRPFAIQNFQRAAMDLAKSAYDRFPREEREISTVTMSIDNDTYEIVKKKLAKLRSEIMELARSVKNPQRVYQLNFQLFPASKKKEESDS